MHALVTGGSSGIGLEVARRFLGLGWDVTSFDLHGATDLPAGLSVVEVDVRSESAVQAAVGRVVADVGPVDVLVNSAGISGSGPLETLDSSVWHAVMNTNLGGAFHMLQAVGRIMLEKGSGAIVNISSISGERGSPGRGAYSASKAALVGLTRTAAVEWAQRGVRVNAVAPGYVDTPFLRGSVESGRLALDDILARIPMRALTPVSQVAEAVLFLASERAAFITGQVLAVDGGFLADFGVAANGS